MESRVSRNEVSIAGLMQCDPFRNGSQRVEMVERNASGVVERNASGVVERSASEIQR